MSRREPNNPKYLSHCESRISSEPYVWHVESHNGEHYTISDAFDGGEYMEEPSHENDKVEIKPKDEGKEKQKWTFVFIEGNSQF